MVVTKIDMCPPNVLQETMKLLVRILKSPGCRKIPVLVQSQDDVVTSATNFTSERCVCVCVCVRAVSACVCVCTACACMCVYIVCVFMVGEALNVLVTSTNSVCLYVHTLPHTTV